MKSVIACLGAVSIVLLMANPAYAKQFRSTSKATDIIELFTSEGCSSCPPADRWLSGLKKHPRLFTDFIPLAFHVDYWDQLGWKDRFANQHNTHRQSRYLQLGSISQIYTPGFVVNNKEWRGFFNGDNDWPERSRPVGVLSINIKNDLKKADIQFIPDPVIHQHQLTINLAVLGMNLSTGVKSGENRGRILLHDFVVLSHAEEDALINQDNSFHSLMVIPGTSTDIERIIVVWISDPDSLRIIQATGGYL
ncbi:MAG: DUF1223 domain-containing protein [Gammaproteobacteria bacterium]|nr:DUF1223 domain-containing protein [Gammaproteobacteria bacterium]